MAYFDLFINKTSPCKLPWRWNLSLFLIGDSFFTGACHSITLEGYMIPSEWHRCYCCCSSRYCVISYWESVTMTINERWSAVEVMQNSIFLQQQLLLESWPCTVLCGVYQIRRMTIFLSWCFLVFLTFQIQYLYNYFQSLDKCPRSVVLICEVTIR